MRKYKLIGLTGQSGAGKSTVSKIFSKPGARIINADEIVSELYTPGSYCLKAVAACFGADIINRDGSLNRKLLAERAFSSKENTAALNAIVHPFVTARLFELLKGAEGIVVFDAPKLFDSGADVICDSIIAVVAVQKLRLERIMRRDGLTEDQAVLRIKAQFSEDYFKKHADIIIENNSDEQNLLRQGEKAYYSLTNEVM